MTNEALVFLKRWKDSPTHENTFETLSDQFSDVLGVHNDLERRELKQLVEVDYFRLIDQRVLSELANEKTWGLSPSFQRDISRISLRTGIETKALLESTRKRALR